MENAYEITSKYFKESKRKELMDQDWKPVLLRGAPSVNKTTTSSSFISHQDAKNRKLDCNEEVVQKKTNMNIRTMMQQKRMEMGLSQKQLASRLNEPEHVVKDIENGKLLTPDPSLASKIKRILNISFKLT